MHQRRFVPVAPVAAGPRIESRLASVKSLGRGRARPRGPRAPLVASLDARAHPGIGPNHPFWLFPAATGYPLARAPRAGRITALLTRVAPFRTFPQLVAGFIEIPHTIAQGSRHVQPE